MKGSIHVCEIKEKLDRTSPPGEASLCLGEFDVGKFNGPMIR